MTLAEHNRNIEDGEEVVSVDRIIKHSRYDAAILKLKCHPKKDTIKTIDISGSDPDVGDKVMVAGWGWTRSYSPSLATTLQKLELPIASRGDCAADGLNLGEHDFCGGAGTDTYTNICHGDDGSPIFKKDFFNHYKLIGLAKGGTNYCPANKNYAIFMESSYMKAWISTSTRLSVDNCYVEDSSCFPGSSVVQLESTRSEVPIHTLIPGDLVLAMSSSGTPVYSQFLGHFHFDSSRIIEYLEIKSSDKTIRITDDHLLYVSVDGQSHFDYARNVQIGHYILSVNGNGGFDQSLVKSVGRVNSTSLYGPLTSEGTIIVDGVVASCYAHVPHTIAHIGMWPYRMWRQYISNSDATEELSTYVQLSKDYIMPLIHLFTN